MEEPKIIDMEVHYNSRWEKFKHKCWVRWQKVKNFVLKYPKEVFSVAVIVFAFVGNIIKKWKSIQPTQAELDREWKDTHIYDRSLGMYYPLRRKMTPRECMEFERRKRNGEPTGHILESMRLLKY